MLIIKHDDHCGSTRWKAAKAVSRTMPSLDETGLEVGGCRHAFGQKAVKCSMEKCMIIYIVYYFIMITVAAMGYILCTLFAYKGVCSMKRWLFLGGYCVQVLALGT